MPQNQEGVLVGQEALRRFCVDVFRRLDVPEEDAAITTDVLLAADLRGIDSHGVARLRRYVNQLQNGLALPRPEIRVVSDRPAAALIDAGAGLGQPVSYRAMGLAIDKAQQTGAGFVTVRNSNHYGIAGYYAMMALEQDCIGISMTTASPTVTPTHGQLPLYGTNPIALAAPAGQAPPFVLDMATSVVARGKAEIADRQGKPLPVGWAVDADGQPVTDASRLENGPSQAGGWGLLPLGGAGELLGGHKGYGLALGVEILSALLSGAAYADLCYPHTPEGTPLPSQIGHFFGAWHIESLRPVAQFKADMDDLQHRLKTAPKARGQDRIYVPGEKEHEEAARRAKAGIPLLRKVADDLAALAEELGITLSLW